MAKIKDLKILRARPSDAAFIYQLILLGTRRGKVLKRSLSEVRKQIRSFFVAQVGREMVGCVSLDIYNKKLAEVRSLVVRPPWERREIASALIERCLREGKTKKIYELLAITDKEQLFKRFHFNEELQGQKALFRRPGMR